MQHTHDHSALPQVEGEHSTKEIVKFVLVIVSILIGSLILLKIYGPQTFQGWSRWFMGVFFVIFASFKLVGYKMFTMMFAGYDVLAKRFKLYAYLYPFIELGLGIAYLWDISHQNRDIFTLVIMALGSIGVFQEVRKRSGIHCACLGNVIKLPLSTVSLVEDVGMGIMALIMIALR